MKPSGDPLRICIHPKDIALITGFSEGYARKIIRTIKLKNNKQPHQLTTIKEVCQHLGLDEDEVRKRLY